jgi:hypothetical protein
MPDTGSQEKASRIHKKQNNSPFIHLNSASKNAGCLILAAFILDLRKGNFTE